MSMDRKIERSLKPLIIKSVIGVTAAVVLGYFTMGVLRDSAIATFRVDREKVTISAVTEGTFEDFIPVRGTVMPLKTFTLVAVEGGQVETIHVENGAHVEQGQRIMELSNTNLQLNLITSEARVTEQLNNLRNTRLSMEQNRLSLQSQLVDIDYNISRLERIVRQRKELAEQRLVSRDEYQNAVDELDWYRKRREITLESQEQDERMRASQVEAMEDNIAQLEQNLEIARKNLDNLIITAPISGRLSSFDSELGESKSPGETVGLIDDVERFKLTVPIDEFYIRRISEGQYGEFTLGGKSYGLRISRVYPQVNNGQFDVDMEFVGEQPPGIYRGQTLQPRVQLGDASTALLLPRGGFFQDTGGNWAFVLDGAGQYALRREIRLGRRNAEYFEVLEGLEPGEQVITSEYAAYAEMERIEFN